MNETERWAAGEGPEPPPIRAFLDAARDVPPMTAEEGAHLEHVFRVKLAARRQAAARSRRIKKGLWAGGAAAAFVAIAAAVVTWLPRPRSLPEGLGTAILSELRMQLPIPTPRSNTTVPKLTTLTSLTGR